MATVITGKHGKQKYAFYVKNADVIAKNLGKRVELYKERSLRGVMRSAFLLRRKAIELTPKDTGNLRESYFVVWSGGTIAAGKSPHFRIGGERGVTAQEVDQMYRLHNKALDRASLQFRNKNRVSAAVGLSAWYALFVHEIPKKHKVGQWKFLSKAFRDSEKEMKAIIKQEIVLKGTPGRP